MKDIFRHNFWRTCRYTKFNTRCGAEAFKRAEPDLNKLATKFKPSIGSGIMLTNNDIKDIAKLIRFLENKGIFLKRTTKKIIRQKGLFLNFLRPLIATSLP